VNVYFIARSYSKIGKYARANSEIEEVLEQFDYLAIINYSEKLGILYIENIFRERDYYRANAIINAILRDESYSGNGVIRLKELSEFFTIITGQVKDLTTITNPGAFTILDTYKKQELKSPTTTYYLSTFIPGSGYIYNGNYKMGAISALVNIPLAIYLGSRIINISDAVLDKKRDAVISNSLDFVLIYNMVYSRYYQGSRREAVQECKVANEIIKDASLKELYHAYKLD